MFVWWVLSCVWWSIYLLCNMLLVVGLNCVSLFKQERQKIQDVIKKIAHSSSRAHTAKKSRQRESCARAEQQQRERKSRDAAHLIFVVLDFFWLLPEGKKLVFAPYSRTPSSRSFLHGKAYSTYTAHMSEMSALIQQHKAPKMENKLNHTLQSGKQAKLHSR